MQKKSQKLAQCYETFSKKTLVVPFRSSSKSKLRIWRAIPATYIKTYRCLQIGATSVHEIIELDKSGA